MIATHGEEEEIQTRINDARLAGEKVGEEKGRADGERKARIETAKKMLSKGLNISDISDFTGLSVEKIQSL